MPSATDVGELTHDYCAPCVCLCVPRRGGCINIVRCPQRHTGRLARGGPRRRRSSWLEKISDKGLILKAFSLCVQGLHQRIVGLWPSAKSACKRDYARVQHRRPSPMLVHVAARLAATTCTATRESTSAKADLGRQIRKPQPDWRVSSHPVAWSTTTPRWNGQTAGIGSCGCQCDVPTLPPCGKNKRDKAYWPPLQWFKKQSKKQRDRAKAMAV